MDGVCSDCGVAISEAEVCFTLQGAAVCGDCEKRALRRDADRAVAASALTRRLSSSATFLDKVIILGIWIIMVADGTFQLFVRPETVTFIFNGVRGAVPWWGPWLFLAVFGPGTVFLWRTVAPLKRVRLNLTDGALYVSNYLREVAVRPDQVLSVTQDLQSNNRPVTLHLRSDLGFGKTIVFMPASEFSAGREEDAVVSELREWAGLSRPTP